MKTKFPLCIYLVFFFSFKISTYIAMPSTGKPSSSQPTYMYMYNLCIQMKIRPLIQGAVSSSIR